MLSKRIPSRDGRWTQQEHELFLEGMTIHGRSWTKVAEIVKTRTTVQVRSHAQKFEMKAAKRAQRALNAQARARGKQSGGCDISGVVPRSAEVSSCAFDLSDYKYNDPHDVSAECGGFEVTSLTQMGTSDASTTTGDLHMLSYDDVEMDQHEPHAGSSMWYNDEVNVMGQGGGAADLSHDIDISSADAMLIEDALMLEEPYEVAQPMGNMWETEYDGFLNLNPAEADLGHISHNISSETHDISGADSMFSDF
jgi:SHAQKYF class myb-like DNA-binding protein